MKKIRKILCMGAAVFAITACCACGESKYENPNTGVPDIRYDMFAPTAYSLGDALYWSACAGATSYEIYKGEEKVATVNEIGYTVGETAVDLEYRVKAKYPSGTSEYSNATTVSKNINFSDDEILILTENMLGKKTVSASVRKIVIKRDEQTDIEGCFALEERKTDIIFELANVTLKKPETEDFMRATIAPVSETYFRSEQDWSAIFDVEGECTVDGYIRNQKHWIPDTNSEERGDNGRNGASAVYLSSVVVRGSGSLTLQGGNGRDGTRGASATLASSASYGHGGNGGDGAAPIFCQYLLLDYENAEASLTLLYGTPGKAGGRGNDPKSLTENIKHFGHLDVDCDGKNGTVQTGVIGNKIVKSGVIVDAAESKK